MAFEEIVRRYKNRMYNTVYRLLGNTEDAQEIALDTFVQAYKAMHSFREESSLFTWLYRIGVNLAKNRLRDQGRTKRNPTCLNNNLRISHNRLTHEDNTPRNIAQTHETEEILQNLLDQLPEPLKVAFVLRVIQNLKYEEIAEVMDCPIGTVKSRINQARNIIKNKLIELEIL